jgi:hypothetical protein
MPSDPLGAAFELARQRDQVLLAREALALGLTPRELAQLRLAAPVPVLRGTVTLPPLVDPVRTTARAAQLAVPSGVISHTTAAHLHGIKGLGFWEPSHRPHLTLPPAKARRQRGGLRMHFRSLDAADVVDVGGLSVTSPTRTLIDCAAMLDRADFVSVIDNALFQELIAPGDLDGIRGLLRGDPVAWMDLVDGRSESPSETRVRLTLGDGGLPPDELQWVVLDEFGVKIARLDMGYRRQARRVGVEVDSAEHERPRALYRDREKHNALRGLGWDVRQFTGWDANRRPRYVIGQVRDALGLR